MMGLRQRAAGLCGRGRQASRPKAVLRPASGARRENTRSARSASGTTEPLSGPQASTSVVGSTVMAEERTGLLSSVLRAYKVYRLALLVWLDYRKCRKSAEKRKRELGLDPLDPNADDHPEVDGIWRACHGRNASLLLEQIVSLRGLWIKAGQFISSRPDIVPFEYVSALSELQDSVPARPWSEVESTLANELGSDWRSRFSNVDESPLSTASIAQVHVAALKDGRKVALKVMHRGIRRRMRQDLQNLRVLTRALAYFEPDQDYRKIVEEWAPAVKMELDLRREAENLKFCEARMREAGVRVKIPLPVEQDGGSTRGVLCMEFCEGFSPKDTRRMDEAGVDKDLFMRRLVSCFARQIHVDGFYHADPHPGNILVSTAEEDGDASVPVLLDFGLVKTFPSEEMKRAFSKCVYSSYSLNLDELANSFVEMGLLINDGAKDPFRDMNAMRMLFSPTPKSRLKERRAAIRERRKREEEEEQEEERAGRRTAAAAKPKKPVDAWPSSLVFFLRVTGLLKGLCSSLDLEFPYLQVMASEAVGTVREGVPEPERAAGLFYPGVGVGTRMEQAVRSEVEALSREGRVTGIQCSVMRGGEVLANVAAGTLSDTNPRPVTQDTVFNVFSATKSLLAASVHLLVQRGECALDDPVCRHWPEFAQGGKEGVTVGDLLGHRAGLSQSMPSLRKSVSPILDFSEMVDYVAACEPDEMVGKFAYHAISYCWVVGGLVRGITGRTLQDFLRSEFLLPLGLEDSVFVDGVPESVLRQGKGSRIASVSNPIQMRQTGTVVTPQGPGFANPTVFNLPSLRKASIPSANSHMSAEGLCRLLSGTFGGGGILEESSLHTILDSAAKAGASSQENSSMSRRHGLGLQVFTFRDLKTREEVPAVGHLGFGGSAGIYIPAKGVAVAVALNALEFGREASSVRIIRAIGRELGLEPVLGA